MNRRNFIAGLGAVAVALPALSITASATPEAQSAPEFVGLFENEFWEDTEWQFYTSDQNFIDKSLIAEARQYAGEKWPRIVSAIWKKLKGRKTIEVIYLEPTAEEYREVYE